MQYNKTSIQKKRKQLHSKRKHIHSSLSIVLLKVFLLLIIVITVVGGGFLYGSIEGMIASTPTDYNLKPQYSATIIYDDNNEETQVLSDYS